MTFVANAVMVPVDLVRMLEQGRMTPHDFGIAVAKALGFNQPAASPEPVETVEVDTDFVDDYIAECQKRFPNHVQPSANQVSDMIQRANGDLDLLRDILDYTEWYGTQNKINSLPGILFNPLRWNGHDKLRQQAAQWRQDRDSDPNSITHQAMRKTAEVLNRSVGSRGPQWERIREMQEAVNRRKGGNGLATPVGG